MRQRGLSPCPIQMKEFRGNKMAIHTFAAIDVGSFEMGLKIFELSKGRPIRQIDHLERSIDLGTDTYTSGKISYHHVFQVGQVLKEFRSVMDTYRVEDYKAYGTSAIREMNNASLILDQWEQISGIHIDVISNSEQRFLDYKSVAFRGEAFNRMISDTCAIVDIGGGSIQISLFDEDSLISTQNLELGVLRLNEQISHIDARTSQIDSLVEEMVNAQLETFANLYLDKKKIHNIIVVDDYISAVMASRQQEFVEASVLNKLVKEAREVGPRAVGARLGVTDAALPLLYITGVLMRCIIKTFNADLIWAPGVKLCDGIAYEYAEKKKILPPSHNFESDIIACAHNISKRYMGSEERGTTLEQIAMNIFDSTKKLHGLTKRERLLLRLSAILHDCGKYISMVNLAECSYNIIMSTEIIGLSHIEREIVANVVKFNHEDFVYYEEQQNVSDLDRTSYMTIGKLTAILRLANGLDRSHKRKFGDIRISLKNDRMVVSARTGVDVTLEKSLFQARADFFEEVFGVRPVIKQSR